MVDVRVLSMGGDARGFSLVEVLVAMMLLGIVLLGVVPMFVHGMQQNATGADLGRVGAVAVERMELLRSADYDTLAPGGSLTANTPDYFDDSDPDVVVRWQIAANATPVGGRRITVRAIALRQVMGMPKEVVLATVRAG